MSLIETWSPTWTFTLLLLDHTIQPLPYFKNYYLCVIYLNYEILQIFGFNFAKTNSVKSFENVKFAKISSAKNLFHYFSPKNISEIARKASKSQKITLFSNNSKFTKINSTNFSKMANSRQLIPQKSITLKLIPQILFPRKLIQQKLIPFR